MVRTNRMVLSSVLLLASAFSLRADTYSIFDLGNANRGGIVGIDDTGNVVVTAPCLSGTCFNVFNNGVFAYQSGVKPALAFDNGTPCKPANASLKGACNSGHEAYFGMFNTSSGTLTAVGMFSGPDPVADFPHHGSGDFIVINSLGDVAWTDGFNETNWVAIDLTSRSQPGSLAPLDIASRQNPEPATFVLLGTGALGLVGAARRRFS